MNRLRADGSEPAPWESIVAYAADQAGEAAADRGPRRTESVQARYKRYLEWCSARGHTGVELIQATAIWRPAAAAGGTSVSIALEANIVPYHLQEPISHWVLWYHPDSIPGTDDLQPELYMAHLRIFLPSLRADEVVAFQNLPQFRSVPQMAHAHVFLRPQAEATASALDGLRRERLIRSPWAEAERLAGRGHEVGFPKEQRPSYTCERCGEVFNKGMALGLHKAECRTQSRSDGDACRKRDEVDVGLEQEISGAGKRPKM